MRRSSPLHCMDGQFFLFFHSLLRYGVILTVGYAGLTHLVGLLRGTPILNGERLSAIIGLVLAHLQLVIGLIIYLTRMHAYEAGSSVGRFWKFEHIGMMIIAIILVTLGRSLSKRAMEERGKQVRVAVFYLIALIIMLWATPWPFTEVGYGRGWL